MIGKYPLPQKKSLEGVLANFVQLHPICGGDLGNNPWPELEQFALFHDFYYAMSDWMLERWHAKDWLKWLKTNSVKCSSLQSDVV